MKSEDSAKSKFDQVANQLQPQKKGVLRDELRRLEVVGDNSQNNDFWSRQRVDGLVVFNDLRRLISLQPSIIRKIQTELWIVISLAVFFTVLLITTPNLPSPTSLIIVGIGGAGIVVLATRLFRAWWFARPEVITLFIAISIIVVVMVAIATIVNSIASLALLKVAAALVLSATVVLIFHLCNAISKLFKNNHGQ